MRELKLETTHSSSQTNKEQQNRCRQQTCQENQMKGKNICVFISENQKQEEFKLLTSPCLSCDSWMTAHTLFQTHTLSMTLHLSLVDNYFSEVAVSSCSVQRCETSDNIKPCTSKMNNSFLQGRHRKLQKRSNVPAVERDFCMCWGENYCLCTDTNKWNWNSQKATGRRSQFSHLRGCY